MQNSTPSPVPAVFCFESHNIRTIEKDGSVWFVANDVAETLGYSSPKDAIANHCKYAELLKGVDSSLLTDSPRGITVIPERDVYRLIMRSKLESAERFQDWVEGEVLPSIRKTGNYSISTPSSFAEALKLAYEQQLRIEEQQKQIAMDQPKVAFYNAVTDSTDAIDMGQTAKVLNVKGIGRNSLFHALRTVGILDRKNIPKQEYVDRGYFRVIETSWSKPDGTQHVTLKTIVYQKGLDYIRQVIDRNMNGGVVVNPDHWKLPGVHASRRRSGHHRKKASMAVAA